MGRKHLQLNGVPGAPHPSPPQFSDGGLAPSAPRTPHGTKAQENKSKNAQHVQDRIIACKYPEDGRMAGVTADAP